MGFGGGVRGQKRGLGAQNGPRTCGSRLKMSFFSRGNVFVVLVHRETPAGPREGAACEAAAMRAMPPVARGSRPLPTGPAGHDLRPRLLLSGPPRPPWRCCRGAEENVWPKVIGTEGARENF